MHVMCNVGIFCWRFYRDWWSVGGVIIITECGIPVQVPNVNYTPEAIDEMITYYTKLLCNESADGPLP